MIQFLDLNNVLIPLNDRGIRIDTEEVNKQSKNITAVTPQQLIYKKSLYSTYRKETVYPQYKVNTITGRITTSNPNIQGLPKGEIQKIILPITDDYFLFHCDYKQAELKLLADLCGKKHLIDSLNSGMDFHDYIADRMDVSRDEAKIISYAILYGGGIGLIAKKLNCTENEVKNLLSWYRSIFDNKLFPFYMYSKDYVNTWTGRKIPLIEKWKLLNYYLQGGIADVAGLGLIQIQQKITKGFVYIHIYDKHIFCLKDESQMSEIVKIMESVYTSKNGIKLDVEAKFNPEYGGNLFEATQPFLA